MIIYSKFYFLIFSFRKKWLTLAENIDEPSNIKWEYMQYNTCKRAIRKIISILVTLILIIIGIAVIASAKYAEKKIENEFGAKVDCNLITFTKEIAEADNAKNTKLMSPTVQCYCFDQFIKVGLEVNKIKICEKWLSLYLQAQSLNIGVILIVPILNFIISLAIQCKLYFFNFSLYCI